MKIKALAIATVFLLTTAIGPVLAAEGQKSGGDLSKEVTAGDNPRTTGARTDARAGSMDKDKGAFKKAGMHKSSDIVGQTVVSQNGEELGSIDNLVIGDDGQVQYVILAKGGVLGVGAEYVPIPWQAANLRMQEDKLTASIDKQQLDNAPSFEGENWGQIASPQYEQEVHGYFGSSPGHSKSKPSGMDKGTMHQPGMGGSGMGGGSGTGSGTTDR